MDEARKVIRRLERIEALQSERAPAEELLAEVRQLLREGEAWLAAEQDGTRGRGDRGSPELGAGAARALAGCRARLDREREVVAENAGSAAL